MPTSHFATSPNSPLEFKSVQSLPNFIPAFDIKLDNGMIVDRADWAALAVAFYSTDQIKGGQCTATLIGPNVVLTAAHCLADKMDGIIPSTIQYKDDIYQMECQKHPNYEAAHTGLVPRNEDDYALCVLQTSVEGIPYESIDLDQKITEGLSVTLTGFGCVNVRINDSGMLRYDRSYDILRIGADVIYANSVMIHVWKPGGSMVLTHSSNDSDPVVCPGDSGGPVFLMNDNSRRIVGVNSCLTWNGLGSDAEFFSALVALPNPSFKDFLKMWQMENPEATVCGVQLEPGIAGCRL